MPGLLFACRIAAGGVLAALACIPPERLAALPSLCVFKAAFGVECLGCGMTRAICSALHGEFSRALAYNGLVAVMLPAIVLFVAMPDEWPRRLAAGLGARLARSGKKGIAGRRALA